jgi:hypothetical protein
MVHLLSLHEEFGWQGEASPGAGRGEVALPFSYIVIQTGFRSGFTPQNRVEHSPLD